MGLGPDRSLEPVSLEAFAKAMETLAPFEPHPLLAVAVSGGPDSMALAILANEWACACGGSAHAILIDHGLRKESANEIRVAAEALEKLGIATTSERLSGPAPKTGKPAWARRERYRVLGNVTRQLGALHLLTGHHRDDQAETMVLNLERGSGIKGLSGISSARGIGAARLIRPLLSFSKGQLEATANLRGVPIAYDPSNADLAYSRTRVRAQMTEARANRLSETTTRLAQEDAALEITVAELAANTLTFSPLGWARISIPSMAQAPSVIALRLFARTVHAIGGREMSPRQDRVQAALDQILSGKKAKLTIGGTIVTRRQEQLSVWREPGKTHPPNLEQPGKWDGRFDVTVEPFWPEGTEVRFMSYEGLRQMEAMGKRILLDSTAPRAVLAALPGLWKEDKLIAAPSLQSKSSIVDGICLKVQFHPPRPITPC